MNQAPEAAYWMGPRCFWTNAHGLYFLSHHQDVEEDEGNPWKEEQHHCCWACFFCSIYFGSKLPWGLIDCVVIAVVVAAIVVCGLVVG